MADADPSVRAAAVLALEGNSDPEVLAALVDGVCAWRDPVYERARAAALAHVQEVPTEVAPSLARVLVERARSAGLDEDEKWAVREFIGHDEQKARACASVLVRWLSSGGGAIALRAADALVELAPWGESELIEALADESLAAHAVEVVARRRDGRAVESLTRLLGAEASATRQAAALALGELGDPLAAEPLLAALNDEHHEVRVAAATAVDKLGSVAVIASVASMLAPLVGRGQLPAPQTFSLEPGSRDPHRNAADAAVTGAPPEHEEQRTEASVRLARLVAPFDATEEPEPADAGAFEGEENASSGTDRHEAPLRAEAHDEDALHAATNDTPPISPRPAVRALTGIFVAAIARFMIARTKARHRARQPGDNQAGSGGRSEP